jgi:hypothetical protein
VNLFIIVPLALMFVAYATFAFLYATRSPWASTWQGVTLLSQKITMAALVLFFLFDSIVPGDWDGRLVILVSLLVLLTLEAWSTLLGLVHVQQQQRPVSRRQGTGYVLPEHIERSKPPRKGKP